MDVDLGHKPTIFVPGTYPRHYFKPSRLSDYVSDEPVLYTHQIFLYTARILRSMAGVAAASDRGARPTSSSAQLTAPQNTLVRGTSGGASPYPGSVPDPYSQHAHSQREKIMAGATDRILFGDKREKKLTYTLALETIKLASVLDKLLDSVAFFPNFPELMADKELVHIITCDYISRKFQKRKPLPNEEPDHRCQEIERSLQDLMIKMQASLAKIRIKLGVSSISQMLSSECNRAEQMANRMPVYAWVNQLKMQQFEVLDKLQRQGLQFVKKSRNLEKREFSLCRQCPDLIVFSSALRDFVEGFHLVAENVLIVQDKTTSMAVHSLVKNVFEEEEVLVVNPSSVWTAIHVENLLKFRNAKCPVIKVFKKCTNDQLEEVHHVLLNSGSDRIQFYNENITSIPIMEEKLKQVRHALVEAKCSRSGIINPIDYLVNEGGDLELIVDYTKRLLQDSKPANYLQLKFQTLQTLKHVLGSGRIRSAVYLTRSIYDEENEHVVDIALDAMNRLHVRDRKDPFDVAPTNLAISGQDIEDKDIIIGHYIKIPPSGNSNGCFVALILRQPREQSEISGILNRCKEKGLVDYTETEDNRLPKTKKKGKKVPRQQAAAVAAAATAASGDTKADSGIQLEPAFSFNKGVLSTNLRNFPPGPFGALQAAAAAADGDGNAGADADAAQKQRSGKLDGGGKRPVGVSESLFPSKVMQALSESIRRERAQRLPQYRVALKHPVDFKP